MRALPEDRDAGPDPDADADPDPATGPSPDPVTPLDRIAAVGARTGRVARVAAKLDALAAPPAGKDKGGSEG